MRTGTFPAAPAALALLVLVFLGSAVPPHAAATGAAQVPPGCAPQSLGVEDAILTAAESFMINNHRQVFGYARLRRVEGDWARVVVVPSIVTDHAILFLQRSGALWTVVWGPGTGGDWRSDLPSAPAAVFEPCP
jgi:hypothetical protein